MVKSELPDGSKSLIHDAVELVCTMQVPGSDCVAPVAMLQPASKLTSQSHTYSIGLPLGIRRPQET